MRVQFDELFELNQDQGTMSPKRVLRLGAIKLLPEHILELSDTSLGEPLSSWVGREFEVRQDEDWVTIVRIMPLV